MLSSLIFGVGRQFCLPAICATARLPSPPNHGDRRLAVLRLDLPIAVLFFCRCEPRLTFRSVNELCVSRIVPAVMQGTPSVTSSRNELRYGNTLGDGGTRPTLTL